VTGPYIVTTKRERPLELAAPDLTDIPISRRAVATLAKARHDAELALVDYKARTGAMPERRFILAARTIAESGGTVGPLPDGTLIEVAPA
jgi:hypothetical protein